MQRLLTEIRACTICASQLPHGPRPVLTAHQDARILLIGQAPGRRVHESGIPWKDPSGVRLRQWLDVDEDTFYDEKLFAILPMGFCYPGTGKSGDLPPRPECAPAWHEQVLKAMPGIQLTLLIGIYAQSAYLDNKKTLTDTVHAWQEYGEKHIPLPHPSPRNQLWLKRNPWFETEVLPILKQRVKAALGS